MVKLLSGLCGSRAHGTEIEGSDTDTFEIVAMPIEYYFGLKTFETNFSGQKTIYDIRKFIRLLIKSNPSALELLFTSAIEHPAAEILVDNKDIFLSKAIVSPVLGHCKSTLMRRTDGKGYAHCIRLLRMAREVLRYNLFYVNRSNIDAEFLKDVKRGLISEVFCLDLIKKLETEVKELEYTSNLQKRVPVDKAEEILVNILKEIFNAKD